VDDTFYVVDDIANVVRHIAECRPRRFRCRQPHSERRPPHFKCRQPHQKCRRGYPGMPNAGFKMPTSTQKMPSSAFQTSSATSEMSFSARRNRPTCAKLAQSKRTTPVDFVATCSVPKLRPLASRAMGASPWRTPPCPPPLQTICITASHARAIASGFLRFKTDLLGFVPSLLRQRALMSECYRPGHSEFRSEAAKTIGGAHRLVIVIHREWSTC
jgi:hypothetical protein